jgi:zinc protease
MRHIALLFLIFIITLPARADDRLLDIQDVQSSGGISAWLVEDHSIPIIAINFAFKGAGTHLDPADKQGLVRMVSNTLDEGAGDLDSQAFQKELQDLSITLSFSAGRDHFTGTLKTLTENKSRALELLKLALMQPRFDEEPVSRMRQSNQARIRSSLSDPNWIAARMMNDVAFDGHVYAQNSGGTISSLEAITPDDLRNFHKRYLGKNNLIVAAAGDITEADLSQILDDVFGALPEVEAPTIPADISLQNQGKTFLFEKDIPQTIIQTLQPGIDRKDPDYQTAQVMNFILGSSGFGSRLTKEIREERGLTYGIYSSFFDLDAFDGLSVNTSTANENVGEILSLILAEWKKMKEAPVSDKELEDAKSYLIGSLPLSLTSTDRISGLLLSLRTDGLPIDYLDQREAAINKTSAKDVQIMAQRLLSTDNIATILVGQPAGIDEAIVIPTLPNVE